MAKLRDEFAALGVQGRDDLLDTLNGVKSADMNVSPESLPVEQSPVMEMQQDLSGPEFEGPEMDLDL